MQCELQEMSIYGYVRVSHCRQAASGLGLAAQRSKIVEHSLTIRGHRLVRIFSDSKVSASRRPLLDRPRGRELDQVLVAGDHVVIAKLDRAFRRLADFAIVLERWQARRVFVHLLDIGVDTSSLSGKLIADVMASVAAFESGRIAERIREAKAAMRRQGRSTNGRTVIGYRAVRSRLVPDYSARRIARDIIRMRKRGYTDRQIAAELNRRSLRTCEDRLWSAQAVWRARRAAEHGFPTTWASPC
jgi:DNA invertase Pin-like site-specific DNA recombinase